MFSDDPELIQIGAVTACHRLKFIDGDREKNSPAENADIRRNLPLIALMGADMKPDLMDNA